jgi:hypothetical protein
VQKIVLALSFICLFATMSFADVHVDGYYRKDGTYVQPHYRSNPDNTPNNNWSTQGNVNPYTGQEGTKPQQPDYGSQGDNTSPYGNNDPSPYGSYGN